MKIGEMKETTWKTGEKCMIWLVKNAATKTYLVMVTEPDRTGWWTQFSGSLKEARKYVRDTFC